jgi:hypothetical protein
MLSESLALREAQFGKSHPSTSDSLLRLSTLRIAQQRCGEAVPLSREALATARRYLLERHAFTAMAALGLAQALTACGEAVEARPLALEALRIRTELIRRERGKSARRAGVVGAPIVASPVAAALAEACQTRSKAAVGFPQSPGTGLAKPVLVATWRARAGSRGEPAVLHCNLELSITQDRP